MQTPRRHHCGGIRRPLKFKALPCFFFFLSNLWWPHPYLLEHIFYGKHKTTETVFLFCFVLPVQNVGQRVCSCCPSTNATPEAPDDDAGLGVGVVGGTAGPGEALFQTPGLCSDSALDLGKRIRPCSCQGGLDPRTGSSFQNSPEQGVQFSNRCSSWLGLWGPSRKEWRQSWVPLLEPGGTLGSRVVVSKALPLEGFAGRGPENRIPKHKWAAPLALCSCLGASTFLRSLPVEKIFLLWVH